MENESIECTMCREYNVRCDDIVELAMSMPLDAKIELFAKLNDELSEVRNKLITRMGDI